MGRRRRLALGAVLTLAAGVALAADAPPLQAMRWAPPDADAAVLFAWSPTECLRLPADPAKVRSIEIGRAAFRTPLLLGGQAARAGLACESCHLGGRGNPSFLFPGVSGAPGTADVTLSLFSSRRGNGVHDPKPIPDLSGPRAGLKVAPAELAPFIRGLVVEEFDGPEPSPTVLRGLADYVAALDPAACPATEREPITASALLADARRAVQAAIAAQDDPATARLMLAAARSRLQRLDERFEGPSRAHGDLARADAALAIMQAGLGSEPKALAPAAKRWLDDSRQLERRLRPFEAYSLFNPERLAAWSIRRLPRKPS